LGENITGRAGSLKKKKKKYNKGKEKGKKLFTGKKNIINIA